jgi:hypothetical protein
MQRLLVSLAASVCLVALLSAAPAHAAFVTFVSEAGDNGNDCLTIATPCRQIGGAGGALSKMEPGGIVHVAPGEYGAFELLIPAEIIVDGGHASIIDTSVGAVNAGIAGGAGIVIAVAAGEVVRLRGFILDAGHGVAIGNVGGILHLEDCTFVSSGGGYGIIYQPSAASELYVKDSHLSRYSGETGGGGILVKPVGSGRAKVVLDNVTIHDNTVGVLVDGRSTTGTNAVTIRDSTISGSASFGLATYESGSGTSSVTIEGSNISNNTASFGVGMSGAGATARLLNSAVIGNARGLLAASSSSIISHGGNVIAGNTINGAFTATVPPQ